MIFQAIKPGTLLAKLKKFDVPQTTFAALLDCSDALVSLFLSGEKGLSYAMQEEVFLLLDFLQELHDSAPAPLDFRKVNAIEPLWKKYKMKRAEAEVIRSGRELEAREAAKARISEDPEAS